MNWKLPDFDHQAAREALQTRLDLALDAATQAVLDEHLSACADCRLYAASLEKLEIELQRSLHRRWPEGAATLLPTALASRLEREKIKDRRRTMTKNIPSGARHILSGARSLTYAVAILAFILGFAWVVRTFAPRQAAVGPQPAPASTQTPDTSLPQETSRETPAATAQAVATPTVVKLSPSTSLLFPNVQFEISLALPEAPAKAAVYTQAHPQPATLENLRLMASRLGVEAPVYQQAGEGPDPIYTVTDGKRRIVFPYCSAELFNYISDYPHALAYTETTLPFEQQAVIAEAFLVEHGLIEAPYQVEPVVGYPGGVHFVRTLADRPVIYGVGYTPSLVDLTVRISSDGQVSEVIYGARHFQAAEEVPLLTAAQAWDVFLSGASTGVRYAVNDPQMLTSSGYRSWLRPYPSGQLVYLYGYTQLLQPAEPGATPAAFFNNWQVAGPQAQATIAQLANGQLFPYNFLRAWGTLSIDQDGKESFAIEGWEISPFEDQFFSGVLVRRGDQAFIFIESGEYLLADVPAGLPDQAQIDVRGVIAAPGRIEWATLSSGVPANGGYGMLDACCGGGSGEESGSFGDGSFKRLSLLPASTGNQPTTTSVPVLGPYKLGDKVEGAQGDLSVYRHIYPDGREVIEANLSGGPDQNYSDYWTLRLAGPQVEALQAFNSLPIKVWGKASGVTPEGYAIVEVERFEEAYPGLKIQAWLGKTEVIQVNDQEVVRFTTVDGKQYILASSINPNSPPEQVGLPGDQLLVEGLARPDQSFGSYPLIQESGVSIANRMTSLEGYQVAGQQVAVWDESQSSTTQALQLSGKAVVEKAELVYAAASLQQCFGSTETDPELAPWLYVQPVWRFTGRFEDGKIFEIQVQAVSDLIKSNQP